MKAVRGINLPQQDVISQAILTIVEGVCKENDLDIQYSGAESTDTLPLPRLPLIWDGLNAAKVHVVQRMDQLIAHLAHRWNLSCSIHKLPVEVLVMIFKEFESNLSHTGGNSRLLNLLLVCRTWYEAIMGYPQLWCSYDAEMSDNIAQLVIDRSRMLPLSVHWDTHNMIYNGRDLRKLLDLAIQNSMRIKSLDVRVPVCSNPDIRMLLEAPTPVLETLRIDANVSTFDFGDTPRLDEFRLSEGMHIKNLSLIHVTTPLDSSRLSNLITLALRGASVPQSLELLLGVLSSSQRLEVLHIQEKPESTEEYRANALVVLPHLRELFLSNVPSIFGAAFLASVYTPSCCYVGVRDHNRVSSEQASEAAKVLDAAIWRPGNDQAAVLVGGTGSNAIPGTLRISVWLDWILIENVRSSHERCELRFTRRDTSELASRLGTVLSQLPSSPVVHLDYTSEYPDEQPLADLLPWSELLESLSVRGSRLCRSVLRQLLERYELPGAGRVDWICRRLSRIKLVYERYEEDTVLDGEALLSLVRHRWSGEGGLAEGVGPASFKVWCLKDYFPNLWSLEGDIKRMLPCFELVNEYW